MEPARARAALITMPLRFDGGQAPLLHRTHAADLTFGGADLEFQ